MDALGLTFEAIAGRLGWGGRLAGEEVFAALEVAAGGVAMLTLHVTGVAPELEIKSVAQGALQHLRARLGLTGEAGNLSVVEGGGELSEGRLGWRGRASGEALQVHVDGRGEVTVRVCGPAPPRGLVLVVPRAALLEATLAVPTGDAELDRIAAVVPRDPWAFARLDAETRAQLRDLVARGATVAPDVITLGPLPAARWGTADDIERTLRRLGALASRLRARLDDPGAALIALAANDPDPDVRAQIQRLLDDKQKAAALGDASGPAGKYARLDQQSREGATERVRSAALQRVLALIGAERAMATVEAYPGPWSAELIASLLASLRPDTAPASLDRLVLHPEIGPACEAWAIANTARGEDLALLRRASVALDEGLRRAALLRLIDVASGAELRATLRASPGPFAIAHVEALLAEGGSGDVDEDGDVLLHIANRMEDLSPETAAVLARALGATRSPAVRPVLTSLIREFGSPAALVAAWACGAGFDELVSLKPEFTWAVALPPLLAEVVAERPPRGGAFLGKLLEGDPRGDAQRQAIVDAMAALADRTAVPWLIAIVEGGDFDRTALDAVTLVGEIGEAADIESLLPLTRGLFRSSGLKDAAKAAVARIRERLALGGERGGLSIASDTAGNLSLAAPDDPRD